MGHGSNDLSSMHMVFQLGTQMVGGNLQDWRLEFSGAFVTHVSGQLVEFEGQALLGRWTGADSMWLPSVFWKGTP